MTMNIRYTSIYHPLYTGGERYVIVQGHLNVDKEEVAKRKSMEVVDGVKRLIAVVVPIVWDSSATVHTIDIPPDSVVRYLNITSKCPVTGNFSAAQVALYDTPEQAKEAAANTIAEPFYEDFYDAIAVPIVWQQTEKFDFKKEFSLKLNQDAIFREENRKF